MRSEADRLRVVRSVEQYEERVARAARGARIDKLSVDRSVLAQMPSFPYCVEAEAAEQKLCSARAEVTLEEKQSAWRYFFSLTGVNRCTK